MIKSSPTLADTENYSQQQESKDTQRFGKFIGKLTDTQFAVLFSQVVGEYSSIDLIEALDLTLDSDTKEELGDLWSFRRSNGLGV